ncbi:hypothetical protein ACTQ9L_15105 [Deinococcus wulumuqiensis]|uniref:hypothetical protein n=1 Tax=Deinococcus wulumuqiensis TaxID=980427 RepID=UPI0013C2A5C9|nr:hypothetical protein [Deinococcus wulumuqiensis]
MTALNAVLVAVFVAVVAFGKEQAGHAGKIWRVIGAGLGWVLALRVLLSTLRDVGRW